MSGGSGRVGQRLGQGAGADEATEDAQTVFEFRLLLLLVLLSRRLFPARRLHCLRGGRLIIAAALEQVEKCPAELLRG